MKKFIISLAVLLLAGLAGVAPTAKAQSTPAHKQLKIVLTRQSTVDPVEIMKHLSQKCPNVTLTTNPKRSDFMLHAGGWSGNYRFLVIAHGGDTVYATETALLSNAVKNVCRYLDAHD
ncbi:MAG: hypothetical protein WB460_07270 [Candidatus Acidiferrales bacterium]